MMQTTVTQKVRSFLDDQNAPVPPWSGLDETYRALYNLMRRRKTDPEFWGPLSDLLKSIVDHAVEGKGKTKLAAPQAELLSSWDIDDLVRDLRAALPDSQKPGDFKAVKQFTAQLSANVLGGFLALGISLSGCAEETPGTDAGTDADVAEDTGTDSDVAEDTDQQEADIPSWAEGCSLDTSSIFYTSIENAYDGNEYSQRVLCECMSDLNASWTQGLTELFENETPEQIATYLGLMIECCSMMEHRLGSDYDEAEQQFLSGDLCKNTPVYKGVSFG